MLPDQTYAVAGLRKQTKTYGTCRLAEGVEIHSKRLVIIEDAITTAGQVIECVRGCASGKRKSTVCFTSSTANLITLLGGVGPRNTKVELIYLQALRTEPDVEFTAIYPFRLGDFHFAIENPPSFQGSSYPCSEHRSHADAVKRRLATMRFLLRATTN